MFSWVPFRWSPSFAIHGVVTPGLRPASRSGSSITAHRFSIARCILVRLVVGSAAVASWIVTEMIAPLSVAIACSAAYAEWVLPSVTFLMRSFGSAGPLPSALEPFFERLRPTGARSYRVESSTPASSEMSFRNTSDPRP